MAHPVLMHLAAGTAALGRAVWLLDFSQAGRLPDRNRHPFALLSTLAGILIFGAAAVVERPNREGICGPRT